jgi:hypothetical protein
MLCDRAWKENTGRKIMAEVVYIEARPKAREEHAPVTHYVVETKGDHELRRFSTQLEAITWAKAQGHTVHVARVRHLSDKRIPDHWRVA